MIEQSVRLRLRDESGEETASAVQRFGGPWDQSVISTSFYDGRQHELLAAGFSLAMSRQSGPWIQQLTCVGSDGISRHTWLSLLENDDALPDLISDRFRLADSRVDEPIRQVAKLVPAPEPWLQTIVERQRGIVVVGDGERSATVEICLDVGELQVQGEQPASAPVGHLQFLLLSGSLSAMLELVVSWQQQFGLVLEPLTDVQLAASLNEKRQVAAPRVAASVELERHMGCRAVFFRLFDECFWQIAHNAAVLTDANARRGHLRHCRIGIRRLRSVVRFFGHWVEPVPTALLEELADLGRALGAGRDRDVCVKKILPRIRQAGGQIRPASLAGAGPANVVNGDELAHRAQTVLLRLLAWRHHSEGGVAEPIARDKAFRQRARKRTLRWLRQIQKQARQFDTLDTAGRHQLRRRIKRLRYCCDLIAPMLSRPLVGWLNDEVFGYQQHLGRWHDLVIAQQWINESLSDRPEAADDPDIAFARGWLSARLDALEPALDQAMQQLGHIEPKG